MESTEREVARERYVSDAQVSHGALRESVTTDLSSAHLGLGIAVVVSALAGLSTPAASAFVAGAFAVLFLAALVVVFLRGIRGLDAGRRAYRFAFGWAQWL